ncbi:MAG: medium-chain fatty-acid--CoA ligase [Eggerthellaceae bacterium]|jgi:acyl-CoA synthetase
MITDLKIDEGRKKEYYDKGYWDSDTLNDVWNKAVAEHGDCEYVSDDRGQRFTYAEVDDKASRLAAWFKEQGVESGDVISWQVPIWADFAYVYVAALKVGAVMHPLPRNFNDKDLAYVMNVVGTKVFLCPTFYWKTDYEEQTLRFKDQVPTMKALAFLDKDAPVKHSEYPSVAHILDTYEPLREAPASKADEVVCILSTSGTTGKPKQVLMTHNNLKFSERVYTDLAMRTPADVMIMMSPLNHATGFYHGLISNMMMGARVVLQEHFEPDHAVELINREGVTWSHGATPFVYDLLNYMEKEGKECPSLDIFISGGAPVPRDMVERCWKHLFLLCESYGSTESCPHIFVPPSKALEWNGKWSGIPYEGIEVRFVDSEHNPVPDGEQGEECSRGPHQFVGYLNNPEANKKALDDEGWFYSGDLGYKDADGHIRINGRMKEIIIRGGENISAVEIDNYLEGCPGITDHATVGMPDARLGERICTFVVPRDPAQVPTVKDVQEFLASKNIQKRNWPERIEPIDAIPYTASGKVKRFILSQKIKERLKEEANEGRFI